MKSTPLAFLCLALAAPPPLSAGMRLIPAGSLIQCTVAEPQLNSQTTALGDPVLCRVGYTPEHNDFSLPYESYVGGRFEEYKDPGRFVGKGWMELTFDHVVIEPDTVIPLNARVVGTPDYRVDRQGRILGKGHPVRDAVKWMIPVLWPIDLLTLPRRGPRPTLQSETRLTLKVMDDFAVPTPEPMEPESPKLLRRTPSAYTDPPTNAPRVIQVPAVAPTPVPQLHPAAANHHKSFRPEYVRPGTQSAAVGGYSVVPPRPVYVSPHAQAWVPRTVVVVRNGIAYQVNEP